MTLKHFADTSHRCRFSVWLVDSFPSNALDADSNLARFAGHYLALASIFEVMVQRLDVHRYDARV